MVFSRLKSRRNFFYIQAAAALVMIVSSVSSSSSRVMFCNIEAYIFSCWISFSRYRLADLKYILGMQKE